MKVKKLLEPKLRFNEFQDEWKKTKLGELVNFLDEKRKPIKDCDRNKFKGIYPYYGASGIIDYVKEYIFDQDTILLGEDGANILARSTRLAFIATGKYWVNNHAHVLEPKESNIYFLCELLESLKYEQYNTGTAQPKLNQEVCKNIEIIVPSIIEQEKIGKFLILLNKKIELQKRKIEALKIYKKGLIKKTLNSKIALSWKTFKLRDLLNPGSKKRIIDTSKYQKINIKLNFNGLCKNTSLREMADTRPFYIRHTNEIIIGKQNYFNGSIAIVSPDFDGCICSNAIMSFNAKSDNPKYIYYYISQPDYIKRREFLANGTGQKELSENEFLNFTIHIPSLDTQNHIVKILDSIESKIVLENSKLTYLNSLKTSLLQQMFI